MTESVPVGESLGLVRFDAARRALAEAHSIDEVKQIRDQAEAMRAYLKQIGAGLQMQNQAAEIKIRAERRAGEISALQPRRPAGLRRGSEAQVAPQNFDAWLSDNHIARRTAERWEALASIPGELFEKTIARYFAEQEELTSLRLLHIAKDLQREGRLTQNRSLVVDGVPLPVGIHSTIVLDPPWDWGDEGDVSQFGRGDPVYATMPLEAIRALPVPDLAEPNAHIYLWITNRSLPKGFGLLEAWGFRYVTMLTWCKPSIGMGNYFRGSTEHVLFGVRGSLSLLRRDVGTWFEAPRGNRHSAKPDEFYALVEDCSPGPWLEMFARQSRPGWATWGAEV